MQGMAASGGYYASVACEQIVAEPTTITGSIGVIMNFFVVQELLEGKLGINPVVIKEGRFKDWPSPFTQVTDEQRQYLEKKVITPAYERFVQLIADGREALTLEEVKKLANGSIYSADEALENGLIDSVGYLEEAISVIEELADIEDAQIIQYEKPFSFASILDSQAKNNLKLDAKTLYELGTPKLQYLFGIQ
jgi:protease-4